MNLINLINKSTHPIPWQSGEKIPWNDPEFSQRMLQNHLSQAHDWASRRATVIEQQVKWIDKQLPRKARILDMGCGPGFYTQALSKLGHTCTGIDFSPASIAYAKTQAKQAQLTINYKLADIRQHKLTGKYDFIMMIFGELNAFTKEDALSILTKAKKHLKKGGQVLLELHTFDEVKRQGQQIPSWQRFGTNGLFSGQAHLCLQENFWDEKTATTTTLYFIIDSQTTKITEYASSLSAYSDLDYQELFQQAQLKHSTKLKPSSWATGELFEGKLHAYLST